MGRHNLKRLKKGDMIVFYSPETSFNGGEELKSFTAAGYVIDETPYRAEMTPDFHPFRRNMKFIECRETSILPLKISKEDFGKIAGAMGVKI